MLKLKHLGAINTLPAHKFGTWNMREVVPARKAALADAIDNPSNIEQWIEGLRQLKGHYTPLNIDSSTFSGRVTSNIRCGFDAVDISASGLMRAERTPRDVRLDNYDHYYAIFQTAGAPTKVVQHDTVFELSVGRFAVVHSARPVTYASGHSGGQWLSIVLPRAELISHLGFEPGLSPPQRNARLERLLLELAANISDRDTHCDRCSTWTKLAFFDLLGALYAAPDQERTTSHSGKLFARVCSITKNRFADSDVSAREIADEAGISLRYLQKLFTIHDSTFGHFLTELRLDHAANLIRRRALTNSSQPLSSIAHACGYSDYTHFARAYRQRFGHSPGGPRIGSV